MPDTTLEILQVFMEAVIAEARPARRMRLLNLMVRGTRLLDDTANVTDSAEVRADRRGAAEWLRQELPRLMRLLRRP